MTSVGFFIDKLTGYVVGSANFQGRGRTNFDRLSEFYNNLGTNNPNTQLNYELKPQFDLVTVGTNTDVYSTKDQTITQALIKQYITDPLENYSKRLDSERPLYEQIQIQSRLQPSIIPNPITSGVPVAEPTIKQTVSQLLPQIDTPTIVGQVNKIPILPIVAAVGVGVLIFAVVRKQRK